MQRASCSMLRAFCSCAPVQKYRRSFAHIAGSGATWGCPVERTVLSQNISESSSNKATSSQRGGVASGPENSVTTCPADMVSWSADMVAPCRRKEETCEHRCGAGGVFFGKEVPAFDGLTVDPLGHLAPDRGRVVVLRVPRAERAVRAPEHVDRARDGSTGDAIGLVVIAIGRRRGAVLLA